MKFSHNNPKIDKSLKEFIEDNISLIESGDFKELYKKAYGMNTQFNIGDLTHVLYSIGIDPLEDLTYIPAAFFESCDALFEIDIPVHIEHIDESAFYDCNNIYSITIPKNVIELASWSIAGCEELRKIVILSDVKRIDRLAFGQNPKLEVIYCTQKTAELIENTPELTEFKKLKFKIEVIR